MLVTAGAFGQTRIRRSTQSHIADFSTVAATTNPTADYAEWLNAGAYGAAVDRNFGLVTTAYDAIHTVGNSTSIGTRMNYLVALSGSPSAAITPTTSQTFGAAIGICVDGCGTSGIPSIAVVGIAGCVFDGATVAGDWVQVSSTTAGQCHDAGAATPTNGTIIGRVLSAVASGGTAKVKLQIAERGSPSGVNNIPTCTSYQINYNESTLAGTGGTTAAVNLFTLNPGSEVSSVKITPVTAFTASGLTGLSMSLGANSNNTAYSMACQTGSTCDLTATPSGTNVLYDAGRYSADISTAHSIYAYFTSTGANLNALSAGQVDAQVCMVAYSTTTKVVP